MSGIFGYIGNNQGKDILPNQILRLKSRGAESVGIAFKVGENFLSVNSRNGDDDLKQRAAALRCDSQIGIAECAAKLRGEPSQITQKPAYNNLFAVALDGVIENFNDLVRWSNAPFPVISDEDLMLALLCVTSSKHKIEMLKRLDELIANRPTFAFAPIDEEAIYCKAGDAPLVIGVGDEGFYVSSEVGALIGCCEKCIVLGFGESAKITKSRIIFFDSKYKKIKKAPQPIPDEACFESSYSVKDEIFYCPLAVRESYKHFVNDLKINFDYLHLNKRSVDKIHKIVITGSGCSYNVAKISEYNFQMLTDISTIAVPSGELRYSGVVIDKSTLLIAISHRGENADAIACVRRFKALGAKAIAVTSKASSCLARESDYLINPYCDFDTNDISPRSFITAYLAMSFFALYLGKKSGVVNELYLNVTIKMAEMLSCKVATATKPMPAFDYVAAQILQAERVIVTGMGADYALSMEGADKLCSISGVAVNAECASELAGDRFKLMGDVMVIALATNKELAPKALTYFRRIKALGARVLILTTESIAEEIYDFENIIAFNDSIPLFNPLCCITGIYKIAQTVAEVEIADTTQQAV